MHAFTRLTSFLLFVLSLSFLTCALPTPAVGSKDLAVRDDPGHVVLAAVADLYLKVEAHVDVLAKATVLADVEVAIKAVVADVNACAAIVLAAGVNIDVDAEVKVAIVAKVALIITLIVKACIALVIKFGLVVIAFIFVSIDACLELLLKNLNICIEGIVAAIIKLLVDVQVVAFIKVHLHLLALLGL
ncbi:hypothetical protein FRC12_006647 [Ceratobasidium sp. 428]|nr:hypothetical protein FRC09_020576 [Ceratobasidium sp. 395]KAG8792264.1 hypothetical protein FRC12_006647 [Ceratobasidium sp. 428]